MRRGGLDVSSVAAAVIVRVLFIGRLRQMMNKTIIQLQFLFHDRSFLTKEERRQKHNNKAEKQTKRDLPLNGLSQFITRGGESLFMLYSSRIVCAAAKPVIDPAGKSISMKILGGRMAAIQTK